MARHLRTIPVAAVGLTFSAGCNVGTGIRGTWDAVAVTRDGQDVTESYLYTSSYGGCTTTRGASMVIGRDLNGGFFRLYERDCEGSEQDFNGGYGTYVTVDRAEGRWLIQMGRTSTFDCAVGFSLECSLSITYDYYGTTREQSDWTFEHR